MVQCLDELTPVFTSIINSSLQSGCFSIQWKEALVNPILKKHGLEQKKKNLRPVSNLSYLSKLMETAATIQLQDHMHEHGLYPTNMSSYRKHHSTETVLLRVRNVILLNMNDQQVTLLVLLDFSAAFETVNHDMLLARLQSKLGVRGIALEWFRSYLCNRSQRVAVDGVLSRPFLVNSGVPQGSCLGPLLFNIYVSSLFDTIGKHQPTVHSYADDFQLYLSFRP